jgi:hypothetical protein
MIAYENLKHITPDMVVLESIGTTISPMTGLSYAVMQDGKHYDPDTETYIGEIDIDEYMGTISNDDEITFMAIQDQELNDYERYYKFAKGGEVNIMLTDDDLGYYSILHKGEFIEKDFQSKKEAENWAIENNYTYSKGGDIRRSPIRKLAFEMYNKEYNQLSSKEQKKVEDKRDELMDKDYNSYKKKYFAKGGEVITDSFGDKYELREDEEININDYVYFGDTGDISVVEDEEDLEFARAGKTKAVPFAKGGLTKAELKLNIYEPSGDYFMEKKGGKIILHLTSKDASNLPPSFFERYNVEDNGKGYYGTSYIVSKKYAKGGNVVDDISQEFYDMNIAEIDGEGIDDVRKLKAIIFELNNRLEEEKGILPFDSEAQGFDEDGNPYGIDNLPFAKGGSVDKDLPYLIYVSNTNNPNPNKQLVAKVRSKGDAILIQSELSKNVAEAPLEYFLQDK